MPECQILKGRGQEKREGKYLIQWSSFYVLMWKFLFHAMTFLSLWERPIYFMHLIKKKYNRIHPLVYINKKNRIRTGKL